ncbi:type I-C CRISPR-associated protein Cas8c/Csd1, partial [Marinitenerispora sediminis]
MLLTALVDYARRRQDDLPPAYHRVRGVRRMISLNSAGEITNARTPIHELGGADSPTGTPRPTPLAVRTSGIAPALVVDTAEYVLGVAKDDSVKSATAAVNRHAAYRKLLDEWSDAHPDDPTVQAVATFFSSGRYRALPTDELQASEIVSFQVDGQWIDTHPAAQSFWSDVVIRRKNPKATTGICLVCGQRALLVTTMPESVRSTLIPVADGRGNEVQVVSINKPAQGRGGQIQLGNTPVCGQCAARATGALTLLLSDERHHTRAADSVMTWWTRRSTSEDMWDALWEPTPQVVKNLRASVDRPRHRPAPHDDNDDAFYALTLSANRSRLVVRDWIETTIPDLRRRLVRWFDDHEVLNPWNGPAGELEAQPLWRLALALARYDDQAGRYVAKDDSVKSATAA